MVISTTTQGAPSLKLQKLTQTLLTHLDARSRDVISRRFGLSSGRVETLEGIGKEYGITRERVRQIEAQAKKVLRSQGNTLLPAAAAFQKLFEEHGGLLAEEHLTHLSQMLFPGENISTSHIIFYLEILPGYTYINRDPVFVPHWRYQSSDAKKAVLYVQKAKTILKEVGHPLVQATLFDRISAGSSQPVPAPHIYAHLTASREVSVTPFGEWGLRTWAETSPRGVGDKAYAVLRRHSKPEHFTRITALINEAAFDHKRANAQTVHNELIKDKRFVLVGRGLYGLSEWGYIPGTVADVLASLLARSKEPLTRDELIKQVLAQRQVKKNTILLGLQNEDRFVKTTGNRYTLKENS